MQQPASLQTQTQATISESTMENLLKTLLEMGDDVGLMDMDMISGISWKVEDDKFKSNQDSSHCSFLQGSSFELFSPSTPPLSETINNVPVGTRDVESSPQIWAIEEKGTSSRRLRQLPRAKMSGKRRMKASEREKLRMRRLAHALHMLRTFLPPVYSQRGQTLTKIQTLHCAIQYISELSTLLAQGRHQNSGHSM